MTTCQVTAIKARVLNSIQSIGMAPVDMARELDIDRKAIYKLIGTYTREGKYSFPLCTVDALVLLAEYGVDLNWVLTGSHWTKKKRMYKKGDVKNAEVQKMRQASSHRTDGVRGLYAKVDSGDGEVAGN